MLLSITKIELGSYSKLKPFFRFNRAIISELKRSKCTSFKITGSWNFKSWYTMTLWENENDLLQFIASETHLKAMQQSRSFSNNIQLKRLHKNELISWNEAKRLFTS